MSVVKFKQLHREFAGEDWDMELEGLDSQSPVDQYLSERFSNEDSRRTGEQLRDLVVAERARRA